VVAVELAVDAHDLLAWFQEELLDLIWCLAPLWVISIGLIVVIKVDTHHVHVVGHGQLLDHFAEIDCFVEVEAPTENAALLLLAIVKSHFDSAQAIVVLAKLDALKQATLEGFWSGPRCEAVGQYIEKVSLSIVLIYRGKNKFVSPVAFRDRDLLVVIQRFFKYVSDEATTLSVQPRQLELQVKALC